MTFSKQQMEAKYRYTDEYTHWHGVWIALGIFEIILMAISVAFSYKFCEYFLFSKITTDYAWIPSIILPILVSFSILNLTWRVWAKIRLTQEPPAMQTFILVILVLLNCASDFIGGPKFAEEIRKKPPTINVETKPINESIAKVDAQINSVYSKYKWNGKQPSTIGAVEKHTTKHGHTPKKDADELRALYAEKAIYVNQLKSSNDRFDNLHRVYEANLEEDQYLLRGVSCVVTVIFLIISFWRTSFAVKVANPEDATNNPPQTEEDKKDTKQKYTEEEMKIGEQYLEQLAKENPDVLEEILASAQQAKKK